MATQSKVMILSLLTEPSLDGLTNVVTSISWNKIMEETVGEGDSIKTYIASYPGITPCGSPDPNNFIPFDQLTEQEVIDWVNQNVDWAPIDIELEKQIQNQMSAPVNKTPPWQPSPGELVEQS